MPPIAGELAGAGEYAPLGCADRGVGQSRRLLGEINQRGRYDPSNLTAMVRMRAGMETRRRRCCGLTSQLMGPDAARVIVVQAKDCLPA